jgi:antitoxin (DNA-binding transcriptional repressor) of toxin-antitoxin stability system
MTIYNVHEAKTHFSLKGEEVVIAKAGKPVARILPVIKDVPTRVPGIDKGKVIIMPDFDDPLPEFDV